MADADGLSVGLGIADQFLQLLSDIGRILDVIQEDISLGKGHLEDTGRLNRPRFSGGSAVDEKEPPLL